MSPVPEQMVELHRAMRANGLPHAFGGALALAWCTQRARGTIDIDLNVFVDQGQVDAVVGALPSGVMCAETDAAALCHNGQARLWWDATPVDLFLNTTEYHTEIAGRIHWEPFAGVELPFLACTDLAVFKTFFNRTKDWADLEEMLTAGTLDRDRVLGVLIRYVGSDDPRIERFRALS
jgi:hypothetical protein